MTNTAKPPSHVSGVFDLGIFPFELKGVTRGTAWGPAHGEGLFLPLVFRAISKEATEQL